MIFTFHLLFGAAIAAKIPILPLAFLFCFLSHYFLDFLPHKDLYTVPNIHKRQWKNSFFDFSKVFLDFFFGTLLILILSKNFLLSFSGGFSAALPDGFVLLHLIFPKNKLLKWHYTFHKEKTHFLKKKKIPVFWEIFTQFLILILSIYPV